MRSNRSVWLAPAAVAVLAGRLRQRIGLPPALTTACLFAAPPAIAAGFRRSPVRDAAVWGAQMWAYKNAFELPNDRPERLHRRAHIDYPIAFDTWIGAGMPPARRLQLRLRRRGQLTALDKALTFFYWTWEVEPHLVVAWLRWRRPDAFAGAAARLATVFDLTLVGYWSIPSAPPWWASEKEGRMGHNVRRVVVEVAHWVKRKPHPTEADPAVGANSFAAMPSDHFASATMTALILAEQSPVLGAVGGAYAMLLGLALVYLGEHYVGDLIAGLALALAVNAAKGRLEPVAEAVLGLDGWGRMPHAPLSHADRRRFAC